MASKFPSLEELLQSVSEKSLEEPCSDEHIVEIAREITTWRLIAPHLGLKAVDEEDILQNQDDVRIQRREMLRIWRQKLGSKATYSSLAKALYKTERVDLVEKLAELLTKVHIAEPLIKAAATGSLKLGPSSFKFSSEYSEIVKDCLGVDLESLLQDFKRVGKLVYHGSIAYKAGGSVPQCVEMRITMKDLGYDIAQLCAKSAQTAALASDSILVDLKCTLLEDPEKSVEMLDVVKKIADSMTKAAEELQLDFRKQVDKFDKLLSVSERALAGEQAMLAAAKLAYEEKSEREQNMAEAAIDAIYEATRVLKQLSLIMMWASNFWEEVQQHCQSLAESKIKDMIEKALHFPEERRLRLWTLKGFKMIAEKFYAGWVALNGVCTKYSAQIKLTERDLHEYLKENPTYEQSRRFLQELAKEFEAD